MRTGMFAKLKSNGSSSKKHP